MKKALSLLISCLMLVSLVSCAAGKNSKHTAKNLAGCSEQDGTDLLFYYYEKDGGGAVLDVCTGKNGSNIIQIISLEHIVGLEVFSLSTNNIYLTACINLVKIPVKIGKVAWGKIFNALVNELVNLFTKIPCP